MGDSGCWSHVFTHRNRRRVGDGRYGRHRHGHWSSPSIGDSRSWSPVLTHRNRLCVGACNDGRHKLDHWSSASMGDSRCYCCTDGLHNGTRSVMALVRLSLSQSKVRFVSAALNTFLNIIVTSWSAFLLLSALRVISHLCREVRCSLRRNGG